MGKKILGISAYYHDSAACLVDGTTIVAAAQEERFTRKKHDFNFPNKAVEYCLREGGLKSANELDYVVFYDKPVVKFERLLETYTRYAPKGIRSFIMAIPLWVKKKLWMRENIGEELDYDGKILFTEHHESHAASAFFPSPFDDAAILTIDGVGEWATASLGEGRGNRIKILKEIHFPHSLGLLYSAFTYFTGFKVNSGEYKLMGLAPYGEPKYVDVILNELIDDREDGSFKLNMKYFNYCAGLTMTNRRFAKLFGGPARKRESKITQTRDGSRRLGPGRHRARDVEHGPVRQKADRIEESRARGRRRPELRRKRQDRPGGYLRQRLDPARRGRRRRRARFGPVRRPPAARRAAIGGRRAGSPGGDAPRPVFLRRRDRRVHHQPGHPRHAIREPRGAGGPGRRRPAGGERRRMVPGAHGIRAAGPWARGRSSGTRAAATCRPR